MHTPVYSKTLFLPHNFTLVPYKLSHTCTHARTHTHTHNTHAFPGYETKVSAN